MAEVNIRIMYDANGVPFYPATHVEAIDGLDTDSEADTALEIANLKSQIHQLQLDVQWLQTQITSYHPPQ
ncbi:hypothetical protein [Staphylococcus shinii]|uniref:hypothetical protein n=1 Tax=Staphylococcus shinii TaxID=2912228 RepID=UPI003F873352